MEEIKRARSGHVVIGVDTHKHIHVAVALDSIGGILATLTIATDTAGFRQMLEWATGFGKIIAFGIESWRRFPGCTGSPRTGCTPRSGISPRSRWRTRTTVRSTPDSSRCRENSPSTKPGAIQHHGSPVSCGKPPHCHVSLKQLHRSKLRQARDVRAVTIAPASTRQPGKHHVHAVVIRVHPRRMP